MAGGGQDSWRLSETCQKRALEDRPVGEGRDLVDSVLAFENEKGE